MVTLDEIQRQFPRRAKARYLNSQLRPALSDVKCYQRSFLDRSGTAESANSRSKWDHDAEKMRSFFTFLENKCQTKNLIKLKVVEAVKDLIGKLSEETLPLYLMLPFCHLMKDTDLHQDILTPFVESLLSLDDNSQETIDAWFQCMPLDCFSALVKIFTGVVRKILKSLSRSDSASKPYFIHTWIKEKTWLSGLESCCCLLEKLHTVNESRGQKLSHTQFYAVSDTDIINASLFMDFFLTAVTGEQFCLVRFPFLFNEEGKSLLLKRENQRTMLRVASQRHYVQKIIHYVHARPWYYKLLFGSLITFWCSVYMDIEMSIVYPILLMVAGIYVKRSGIPGGQSPITCLRVRRQFIVEDTRSQLQTLKREDINFHKKKLQVEFDGENDVGNGVDQDYFTVLFEKLLDPETGLFSVEEESQLLWFKKQEEDDTEFLHFTGFMLGLALYNSYQVKLCFPTSLFKKIMDVPVDFSDLEELKPDLARTLKRVLESEEVEDNGLTFEFSVMEDGLGVAYELCENGESKPVTTDNRQEYVDLLTDFCINKYAEKEFASFQRGFQEAFDTQSLKQLQFKPEELRRTFVGRETIDFSQMERAMVYDEGYHQSSTTIRIFWKLVHSMTLEEGKAFLRFLTGTESIPLSGLKITCRPLEIEGEDTRYLMPIAVTCMKVLYLPDIPDEDRLKDRLFNAINSPDQGFVSIPEVIGQDPHRVYQTSSFSVIPFLP